MAQEAKLDVNVVYSNSAELSGWFGNLAADISSGAVSGVSLNTVTDKDGIMRIVGKVVVVIPQSHLSVVVEDQP